MSIDPLEQVVAIGRVLDELGVGWVLGGSLASSFVGEPRSTVDIDVAVALELSDIDELVAAVNDDYYVSAEMAREAVADGASFNLIHFASGAKIDLFALSEDPLDVRQLVNRVRVTLPTGHTIWVGAAPDQVLRKLRWFRSGGEASERQWRDVLSILRVQGARLDRQRLLADAASLGLADLVERALAEVPPVD